MATPPICLFNQFGYCKYKEVCRKHHIDDICNDSSCDFLTCRLRHPKLCNWYSEYGRCKFHPCAFKHEEKDDSVKQMIEKNSAKLKEIEKSLADLEVKENEISSRIEQIKQFEKSVEENEERIRIIEVTSEKKF